MSLITQDAQVIATGGARAFLTQMVAAMQHLALCTVDLFENNFTPQASNVIADFTLPGADWAGYAAKATTGWGAQSVDATGRAYITATPLMEWTGPVAGGGPTIYGYVVKSAQGGTPLLYSVRFAVPKPMAVLTNVLDLAVTFTFPNTQLP